LSATNTVTLSDRTLLEETPMFFIKGVNPDLEAEFDPRPYPLSMRVGIIFGLSAALWGVIIVSSWGAYSLLAQPGVRAVAATTIEDAYARQRSGSVSIAAASRSMPETDANHKSMRVIAGPL
jgi:hypothetical protein